MHLCLPQKMTPENLAQWITTNSIEERIDEQKIDLTDTEIQKFEHDSSVASRSIDRLNELKDKFVSALKDGTNDPTDYTIPPTVGLKVLQERREYADTQIEQGYRIVSTTLYGIPYPETRKIVFVDIEGAHWENYDLKMNPPQIQKYAKPLLESANKKEFIPGFEVTDIEQDGTVVMQPTKGKKKPTPPSAPSGLPFEGES